MSDIYKSANERQIETQNQRISLDDNGSVIVVVGIYGIFQFWKIAWSVYVGGF